MCRDPKDPHLIELEKDAFKIVGHDWQSRVDKFFIESLGKFRKYDGKSVQDLLRALRNKVFNEVLKFDNELTSPIAVETSLSRPSR